MTPALHGSQFHPDARSQRLSGWGRQPVVQSEVFRPETLGDLRRAVEACSTVIPRGLGRSYGDASLNGEGSTLLSTRMDHLLAFDPNAGIVECEGGVGIRDLLDTFVPRGFVVPVLPGTSQVTVGGAVACDVHGKNHHVDGTFGRHVLGLELVGPSGARVWCSREENPDLFRASLGGMGLTGMITRVRLRLEPVSSAYVSVDCDRVADLDEALDLFEQTDDAYRFSVAWIDALARGGSLGRSLLIRGNPLPVEQLTGRAAKAPLERRGTRSLDVPFDLPSAFLTRPGVRLFNGLYYRMRPSRTRAAVRSIDRFFFPLDRLGGWNRLYGKRGLRQYQFVVPFAGGRTALIQVLEEVVRRGGGSFLAVLKRFGDAPPEGLLSFPAPGYTLALDFARGPGLDDLLTRLDRVVLDHGGRVYLAKDDRLDRDTFRQMYPEVDRWLEVKRAWDPDGLFESEMSRRLGLGS